MPSTTSSPRPGTSAPLPPLVRPAPGLSAAEMRRYSRHLTIPEIGTVGQRRLKAARVLCVGAGGLGSPALLYLAAAGVGTLGIVDDDAVEESNLQRQVIHGQSDVGRPKTQSARDRVQEVNPHVAVTLHEQRLDSRTVMDLVAEYDLVVDGTDNFATRYLVNDACVLLGAPYVWGSVDRFDGQAGVFWAQHGPCYRCLHPQPPPAGTVPSCADGGVLGVVCASIGSIQVTEAVKLITGVGDPLVGRVVVHDARAMSYRWVEVRKDPTCPVCGEDPTITTLADDAASCGSVSAEASVEPPGASPDEPDDAPAEAPDATVSVTDLARMLRERASGDRDFLLLDVREPAERDRVSIPGARLVPKDELLSGGAVAHLPRHLPIVVHCASGARSARVVAALRGAGIDDAVHLAGGIAAWIEQAGVEQAGVEQIGPRTPRY